MQELKYKIHTIRGKQVMLDSDLAKLYEIQTSNLNKAVKRNIERFPPDFMFQLTKNEFQILIFQSGISSENPTNNKNKLNTTISTSPIKISEWVETENYHTYLLNKVLRCFQVFLGVKLQSK